MIPIITCPSCDSTKIIIKWVASCTLDGKNEWTGEDYRQFECRDCGEEWTIEVPKEM